MPKNLHIDHVHESVIVREGASADVDAIEFYDSIAAEYDTFHTDDEALYENKMVSGIVGEDLWEGERILDVGCGTGLLLDFVPIPKQLYKGVDASPKMVARAARKHRRYDFQVKDVTSVWAPDDFGLVVSLFGVLSYVDNLEQTLRRMLTVMNDEAKLFFMVYKEGYKPRTHEKAGRSPHYKTYTPEDIREVMHKDWGRGMVLELGDFVAGVGIKRCLSVE